MSREKELKQAVEVLRSGGVVLYPAETVWGIGCDPFSEEAVEKVFSIKKRDPNKVEIDKDSIVKM